MPEKKLPGGIVAVDPEAQKFIRDQTKPYVQEMIEVLVNIARDAKTGPRDRMKAAVRVIDYHARGTSLPEELGQGSGSTIVVVNAGDSRAHDEAVDELRRLQKATQVTKN